MWRAGDERFSSYCEVIPAVALSSFCKSSGAVFRIYTCLRHRPEPDADVVGAVKKCSLTIRAEADKFKSIPAHTAFSSCRLALLSSCSITMSPPLWRLNWRCNSSGAGEHRRPQEDASLVDIGFLSQNVFVHHSERV